MLSKDYEYLETHEFPDAFRTASKACLYIKTNIRNEHLKLN